MKHLPTDPYKGVRDFYPEDMAVQQHIFNTWSQTAESFGFERYDASVLEPSELYKSKGAANEEMVNEQTYTFTDRGEREVTLRPEMTPSVARMIAARSKELAFPVRWYSIPNLFRYERTQRGRVREHWQLNCDIFGSIEVVTDVEIIALAYQTIVNFGARPEMFEIRVNDRREMKDFYASLGVIDEDSVAKVTRLNDRFHKIDRAEYLAELRLVVPGAADAILAFLEESSQSENEVTRALNVIGINNVRVDRSLARGFDYYTGTIFEFFDTDPLNNRSMLGGGRYDNLTELFGGESISGVGFGMGDVTMRDFLETHDLLPSKKAGALVTVIPTEATFNIDAEKAAMKLRAVGATTVVDISTKKLGKKIAAADHSGAGYILVVGEDEVSRGEYVLKNLADGTEMSGTLEDLAQGLSV